MILISTTLLISLLTEITKIKNMVIFLSFVTLEDHLCARTLLSQVTGLISPIKVWYRFSDHRHCMKANLLSKNSINFYCIIIFY